MTPKDKGVIPEEARLADEEIAKLVGIEDYCDHMGLLRKMENGILLKAIPLIEGRAREELIKKIDAYLESEEIMFKEDWQALKSGSS